ncbi:MAG: LysM peptidoglycan-binding domain-containing protein [Anaerolineae bacterium]|nr:LysM peptidoglycan-binding domain-containing protein [Anaerolineae bacterium]
MRYLILILLLAVLATGCTLTTSAPTPVPPPQPLDNLADGVNDPVLLPTEEPLADTGSSALPEPASNPASSGAASQPVANPPACVPRTDWAYTYVVPAGDTLSAIAQRAGLTTAALAAANCLPDANVISVGQALRVPRAVTAPLPPTVPGNSGSQTYTNAQVGFALDYPAGWSQIAEGNYVDLIAPDGRSFEILFVQSGVGSSPQELAESCKQSPLCIGDRKILLEQALALPDGLSGYRLELSASLTKPDTTPGVYVFALINNQALTFRGFSQTSPAFFDSILNTLRLLRF